MPFRLGPDRKGRWIDVTKLVFIDEIQAKTNMTPLYGRAEIGRRVIDFVPHGHWQTTAFLAALRHDGLMAPIESVGAWGLYLPAYSPDLNPIENVFSKLKTLVRKLKLRKVEDLWRELGKLCDVFSPQECLNYFCHAGYQKTTKLHATP